MDTLKIPNEQNKINNVNRIHPEKLLNQIRGRTIKEEIEYRYWMKISSFTVKSTQLVNKRSVNKFDKMREEVQSKLWVNWQTNEMKCTYIYKYIIIRCYDALTVFVVSSHLRYLIRFFLREQN